MELVPCAGATALAVVAFAVACSPRSDLEAAAGASSGAAGGGVLSADAGPGALAPAPCRIVARRTLHSGEDDVSASAVAFSGDQVGMIYWSGIGYADELRATVISFDGADAIGDFVSLRASPLTGQSGIASFHGAFHAVWPAADGAVHVARLDGARLASDVVVGSTRGFEAVVATTTGDGAGLVVAFGEHPSAPRLTARTSTDGLVFSPPVTVSTAPAPGELSAAPADGGAALGWNAHRMYDSQLHFAMLDDSGAVALADTQLTHHEGYVFDVAVAHGAAGFVIATTDSRDDIHEAQLHATTVSNAGGYGGVDTRLTRGGWHGNLAMTWDGASCVVAYDEFVEGVGAQIRVRQLDDAGRDLFGPFQVSAATFVAENGVIDTRVSRVVGDGAGRVLVVWSEATARPGSASVLDLEAALLDCAAR